MKDIAQVFWPFALVSAVWIGAALCAAAAPAHRPAFDSRMLIEGGDYLGDEVLAWQRLRAERRMVVEGDDSAPIACTDAAGRLYLATASGRLMASDDNGKSFPLDGRIKVNGVDVSDLQAFGVTKSKADYQPWLGQARGPLIAVYAKADRLLSASSEDGGETWASKGELRAPGYTRLRADGVRILETSDGRLLMAVSARIAGSRSETECLVMSTGDCGTTWDVVGNIGAGCTSANLLELRTGALLAAIAYQDQRRAGDPQGENKRKELYNNVVVARSDDGGKTWKEHRFVTRYKESPADLTALSDGRILLTYGQRNFPYGARAMVSKDDGRTWSKRFFILGFSTHRARQFDRPWPSKPGWRASSVVLKDGSLLTMYTRGPYDLPDWALPNGVTEETMRSWGKGIVSVHWSPEGLKLPPVGPPAGVTLIAKTNSQGYLDNGRFLVKPEQLNFGGDYFENDEILVSRRIPAEHHLVGPGPVPVVCYDTMGNLVVSVGSGQLYTSTDNGRKWIQTGAAPPDSPGNPHQRWVSSFGVLRDGTMIIVNNCFGSPVYTEILRSSDSGKTWSEPYRVDSSPFDFMGAGEAYHVLQMPDDTILITTGNMYLTGRKDKLDVPWDGVLRSRDGGKTWGDLSYIGHHACETNLLRLKSGRLLAAIRAQGSIMPDDFYTLDLAASGVNLHDRTIIKNSAIAFSDDNGYTWTPYKMVTRFCECAADAVETEDGAIVFTYQQKNHPNGARAVVSRDGGNTWAATLYMLGWYPMSGGMTSSVVLKDGRVLTMRSGWQPGETGNTTSATIWKPLDDDTFGEEDDL